MNLSGFTTLYAFPNRFVFEQTPDLTKRQIIPRDQASVEGATVWHLQARMFLLVRGGWVASRWHEILLHFRNLFFGSPDLQNRSQKKATNDWSQTASTSS